MYCPLCARPLEAVERLGIEIDHCPDCGGFWLDQGEMDTLVRREAAQALEKGHEALIQARRDREYDEASQQENRLVFSTGYYYDTEKSAISSSAYAAARRRDTAGTR